jgi:hypothetical protein
MVFVAVSTAQTRFRRQNNKRIRNDYLSHWTNRGTHRPSRERRQYGGNAPPSSALSDASLTRTQIGKVKICGSINDWKIGKRVSDLFHAIRRHQLIHWFDLQGCMLGNDRVRKGLETLQTVKSLETLDLQDNEIDRSCLHAIQEFLCASNVKQLYLQGNPLNFRDFDELEPIVSKLGRECTVYCYKEKDQPMRKLICSVVKQVGGFDDSLSFSNAQLSSIFQKYQDRVAFFQNAVDEEIVYSHKSKAVTEICEVPVLDAVDDSALSPPAKPSSTNSSARVDTVVFDDAAGAALVYCASGTDLIDVDDGHVDHYCASGTDLIDVDDGHLDHNAQSNPPIPSLSLTCPEPSDSSLLTTAPAPASSDIDTIVAMGFEREAAFIAYNKSGRDVQVCHLFLAQISTF